MGRGEVEGSTDNRAIAAEMVQLRAERARLLGFESFAHYRLDDTMAKTPQAVGALLRSVFEPALALARREEAALQAIAASEGGNFKIAPWDWRYYAEKHRKRAFDFDEREIRPYLQLENISISWPDGRAPSAVPKTRPCRACCRAGMNPQTSPAVDSGPRIC
jgi:peptidyl-dipeptidase Dcp